MGLGQIQHMDIVTHRRAVGRVVVGAEDGEGPLLALRRLDGQGDGVGLGLVALADAALRVSAGRVEIAQGDRAKAKVAGVVGQSLLDHQLGPAIRAEGGLGLGFVDRQAGRIPVNGAGRGEDQGLDPASPRGLDQGQGADDIDGEIGAWVLAGG